MAEESRQLMEKCKGALYETVDTHFQEMLSTTNMFQKIFASEINELNNKEESKKLLQNYQFSVTGLYKSAEKFKKGVLKVFNQFCQHMTVDVAMSQPHYNITALPQYSTSNTRKMHNEAAVSMASTINLISDEEEDDIQITQLRTHSLLSVS